MKKQILAALLSMLLLVSCSALPESAESAEPRTLTLFVQNSVSDTAKSAVDIFKEKAEELSDGKILIDIEYCDDTIAELDAGCDLIFANNAEIVRAYGDFSAFTSPFYFYDYTHMTTTLNCEDLCDIVNERLTGLLGAVPLATFYGGSHAFVSNESEFLDVWDAWQGLHVTISRSSTQLAAVLEALGAEVSMRDDADVLSGFLSGAYRTVECNAASLAEISDTRIKNERVYAYRSFHTANAMWLMISDSTRESLTRRESAVLTESAAAALAANDTIVYGAEERAFSSLEELGVPIFEVEYEEFNAQVCDIFKSEVRYRNLWDWEIYETLRTMTMIE